MSYFLSPVGNDQQCDANGNPLVGGKIYTYIAGSSTSVATYTDNTSGTQQTNPIILNSLGLPFSPIWMSNGVSVKFVIKDALDVLIRTVDNVSGINDTALTVSEWTASGLTPTYISATSFSLAGDQTPNFQVGRRLLSANTAGTRYSTITASTFAAGTTTVTVTNDSGTLDSGLSSVSYGLLSITNPSVPANLPLGSATATTQTAGDNTTKVATTAFVSTLVGGTTTATASKLTNGYQKLSSGVIIQWGSSSITAGGPTAVSFPFTFPTAVGSIQMTISSGTTPAAYNDLLQGGVTTSGFNAYGGPGMAVSFTWLAIGW